jgi:hypothetical protein
VRRIFVLMGTADDAEAKDRAAALQEGLQKLRWNVGRDLQINYSLQQVVLSGCLPRSRRGLAQRQMALKRGPQAFCRQ